MLVNPKGLTALLPCPTKNPLMTKFEDLKVTVLWVDFGEEEHIRLTPMCDDEPKDARKPPFKANEGLNALAKRSAGRMGTGFVERQIFVNKMSLNNW